MFKKDISVREYKLGEVCEIYSGISFKSGQYTKNGFPVLMVKDIQDGKVLTHQLSYCDPSNYPESDKYKVKFGDILITKNGVSTGKVGINLTDTEFILSSPIFKLEPNPEILDKRYLYHFLLSCPDKIKSLVTTGNPPYLKKADFIEIKVPIPSLEVQSEVVSKLNKFREIEREIEREINLRNKQYEYYRDLLLGGSQCGKF